MKSTDDYTVNCAASIALFCKGKRKLRVSKSMAECVVKAPIGWSV